MKAKIELGSSVKYSNVNVIIKDICYYETLSIAFSFLDITYTVGEVARPENLSNIFTTSSSAITNACFLYSLVDSLGNPSPSIINFDNLSMMVTNGLTTEGMIGS